MISHFIKTNKLSSRTWIKIDYNLTGNCMNIYFVSQVIYSSVERINITSQASIFHKSDSEFINDQSLFLNSWHFPPPPPWRPMWHLQKEICLAVCFKCPFVSKQCYQRNFLVLFCMSLENTFKKVAKGHLPSIWKILTNFASITLWRVCFCAKEFRTQVFTASVLLSNKYLHLWKKNNFPASKSKL